MIAQIKFKELKHQQAGSFRPKPDSEPIEYAEKYIFKFADVTADGELFEGEVKIDVNDTNLIDKLSKFKPFDDITVEIYFDIKPKYTKVILKDVILDKKSSDGLEIKKSINSIKEQQ